MEVLVVADSHFYKTPDGKYWAKTIYGYEFWKRYLTIFEKAAVVSRTKKVDSLNTEEYLRVDGPNLRVIELPYLRGMKEYLSSYFKLKKAAKKAVQYSSVAIFRLPSVVADIVLDEYKKTGKPYSIEIVVDPYDAYESNKIAQMVYTLKLKQAALSANGVSYVTKYYLQEKYPSSAHINGRSEEKFETYYSTINLDKSFFGKRREYNLNKSKYTIVHTANSINSEVKGHRTVIEIVKKLRKDNYDIEVVFIGDGTKRKEFEQLAIKNNIEDFVKFTGLLSSSADVRKVLLKGDIFVFPTKAEGLPRAIIEAMAVGLPCLSTPVNGIPELLDNEYLFNPNNIEGFAKKIIELINNPEKLEAMSAVNIEKAKEYTNDKLSVRRNNFYEKLLNIAMT